MKRENFLYGVALLLVIVIVIFFLVETNTLLPRPTQPRCTQIVVNFYQLNCHPSGVTGYLNESLDICGNGPLIGIAKLNETGYFVQTDNLSLDKFLHESHYVRWGRCDQGRCVDGIATLVPGTIEYLVGMHEILEEEHFFSRNDGFSSEIVMLYPENCTLDEKNISVQIYGQYSG